MSRAGDSVTRVDIRFSNEMYEAIQQLAIQDGARTHHISQKVEVSPTIIKLVQFALDNIASKVSDNNINLADRVSDISDISIEAIVDRRLAQLGLFPVCQIESDSTLHSLPDKSNRVPDNIPDKNVIISDRVTMLPDNLPDTINIPSDDSSNSESIAEDVQIIPTDAIEQVGGGIPESLSWGDFHKRLDLPTTGNPSKAKGDIAIATAKEKGHGTWVMNSTTRKFTKLTEDN